MIPLRIAIATARRAPLDDGLIATLIRRLKDVVLVLTDGALPQSDEKGRSLLLSTPGYRFRNRFERTILRLERREMLGRRIAGLIRQRNVEVVLAEHAAVGAELLPICRRAGVPLVLLLHHDHQNWSSLDPALLKGVAAWVVPERDQELHLLSQGVPPGQVFCKGSGIDVEAFIHVRPDLAPRHLLCIGKLEEERAPLLSLLAFERVAQRHSDARMTMLGNGPLAEATQQTIKALSLQGNVDVRGVCTREERMALMGKSRLLIHNNIPSGSNELEGTPRSLMEAMASGLPVVTTRQHSQEGIITHDEQGLLCEPFDISMMADHMLRLVDDPGLAARMGAAARSRIAADHDIVHHLAALEIALRSCRGGGTAATG